MRIALVIERFEPRGGGVEAVAWRVAQGLSAAGAGDDEVHVFARQAAANAAAETGAKVHPLRLSSLSSSWQPLRVWGFSRAAGAATGVASGEPSYDLVQSFSRTRHQDVFRAGGGCHAAYMERAYSPLGRSLRRASPRHALALAIERAVFADPGQLVLCNSEMVRGEIAERHGVADERLAVVVNGVDTERFRPGRGPAAEELRKGQPEARLVWLLVGSGFARKGVATALRALALRPRDEVLWIAGADAPAPWRARAESLGIADRVRFLGHRGDLPDLYAAADGLLLPTRYDAFANVCLEAAAAGLPVVTSAANGAAGWIGAGGIVVEDPDDAEGFAAALASLESAETRSRFGAEARARAEATTWERHVDALRSLYQRWPE